MGSRKIVLGLALLLILSFSLAIPMEKMSPEQLREFNSLAPQMIAANTQENQPMSSELIEDTSTVSFFVESNSKKALKNASSNATVKSPFGGETVYQVNIPRNKAQSFLLDNSVKKFEMINEKPLLNYSNPSVYASTFYNADYNGSSVAVCINDTGVNSHETFSGKLIEDINCEGSPEDVDGHGTHVAGIAAGSNSTYTGIGKGVFSIVNARGFNDAGSGECLYQNFYSTQPSCFDENRINQPVVANNSWGSTNTNCGGTAIPDGNSSSTRFIDAAILYWDKTLVFSAGNDGPDGAPFCLEPDANHIVRPADAYNGITVASMDVRSTITRSDDRVSTFSGRGPTYDNRKKPDITAPGSNVWDWGSTYNGILSADYNNTTNYIPKSGTSMASPHVTGAVALLFDAFDINRLGVKAVLLNSAEDINESGWDKYTGWGYLDLNKAFYQGNYHEQNYIAKNGGHNYFSELKAGETGMIVWDRYCNSNSECSTLTDLNIYLYDESGNLIDSSISAIDNVEQVKATSSGTYQVKISSQNGDYDSGFTNETYAIASSNAFLERNVKPLAFSVNGNALAGQPVLLDVNVQNFSLEAQDINFQIFNSSNVLLDSNYNANFESAINSLGYASVTFSSGGQKNIIVNLAGMITDSNSEDNNISGTLDVSDGEVNIVSAVVDTNPIYASQSIQTVVFDVNVGNLSGANKDINVWMYRNNSFIDSNTINLGSGNFGIVNIKDTVPANTTTDQNYWFTTAARYLETNTEDNNYEKTLSVLTIDSNISGVTPSVASGGTTQSYPITFDVNVENLGYTGKDINLLFYINNTLEDSNTQTVSSGETKEYSFTATMPQLINDINFIASYDSREYIKSDNNYYLQYTVNADVNDANVVSASGSGLLYTNRHVINNNFSVDANVGNIGTGTYNSDLNAILFIDNIVQASKIISNKPGDYNSINFSNISQGTNGTKNVRVNIAPLNGESNLTDNNFSFSLQIDVNATKITSVDSPSSANTDTNQQIDVNIQNLGQDANVTVKLYDQDNNVLDEKTLEQAQNDSNVINLYTQALSITGNRAFTVVIVPLGGEYEADNNFDFNINVSTPTTSTPVTPTGGGGGGGGGGIVSNYETKTDTIEEENSTETEYENEEVIEEINELLSEEEKAFANNIMSQIISSREMVNEIVWDSEGVRTRRTRITIRLNSVPGENIGKIDVVESIPKHVAEDANKITSDNDFVVLKFDPVLKFTVSPGEDINYYVDGTVYTGNIEDFNAPVISGIEFAEEEFVFPDENVPTTDVPLDTNTEDSNNQVISGDSTEPFEYTTILLVLGIIFLAIIFGGVAFYGYKKGMLTKKQAKKELDERVLPKVKVLSEKSKYVIQMGGEKEEKK